MYLAHGPISYLANEVIQRKEIKKLKKSEQILVALCSLFFGILPDFDIFILSIFNVPTFIHHDIITHTPILYIGIWILLKTGIYFSAHTFNKKAGKVLDKYLLNILANTFLIATLFHLLADFLTNSIMIFYPFSDYKFYLLKFLFEPNIFVSLIFSTLFVIEILFIAIFIYTIYKKFIKENKGLTIFLGSLIVISVIYLPISMYVSLNMYNHTYMYAPNGEINYDIDYDSISNRLDMDIGNTGQSNIEKAININVLNGALDIINSNKWTLNHDNDLIAQVKYIYGGFDSYRLVAQTYYNINLPISPELRDYYIKEYKFESYSYDDYDYPSLLFDYLEENNQLIELNLDANVNLTSGKIFFVMTNVNNNIEEQDIVNQEIKNLGITLEGNYLAIVLEEDENLTMHSYKHLREYYKEDIGNIYIQK